MQEPKGRLMQYTHLWPFQMTLDDKPTPGALTFADLFIEPTDLDAVALHFLRRFRSTAVFDMPFEKGEGQIKKGVYHVID